MNQEEILNLATPITMQGERLVEESLLKKKPDAMEPETEVHIQKLSLNFPYMYSKFHTLVSR